MTGKQAVSAFQLAMSYLFCVLMGIAIIRGEIGWAAYDLGFMVFSLYVATRAGWG